MHFMSLLRNILSSCGTDWSVWEVDNLHDDIEPLIIQLPVDDDSSLASGDDDATSNGSGINPLLWRLASIIFQVSVIRNRGLIN